MRKNWRKRNEKKIDLFTFFLSFFLLHFSRQITCYGQRRRLLLMLLMIKLEEEENDEINLKQL